MKKLILFIILLLLVFSSLSMNHKAKQENNSMLNSFSLEEIEFIRDSNIPLEMIEEFLGYSSFNIFNYFEYIKIMEDYNYSSLEALNYYNNPNFYSFYYLPKEANLKSSYPLLVNKCYFLDSSYEPNNLVEVNNYNVIYIKRDNEVMLANKEALENLEKMVNEASKENISLVIFSAYRDYQKQKYLYYEVNKQNDSFSAKPGFSEHQTGLAFDISTLEYGLTPYFETSRTYEWLINNCHKFGFILRYPLDKEEITGYSHEAWHFRFVGERVANIIFQERITLEEYIFSNFEI